ncbi:NrfD/PsrC family molybdoenzyme membrane anchor subunit [Rubneribacter sp.]
MSEKQGFVSGVSGKFLAGALVCAALAVAAFGCWVYQQIGGLGITGMSNATSWGLYIAAFMFCVGLSAGGLIVASSAHVFKIERFKPVALPAVICSTVCICLAGCFVLIDLGGISRVWNMFVSLNLASPLAWDMCVIVCYLVINVLDMVWMVKGEEHKVEVLSRVALPVAILVHSVTAWIFGLEIAREGWHSAIMAPIFVASAMDSGLALLLIGLASLEKGKVFRTSPALFSSLAGLLCVCIAVDAYLIGCELLTMAYPGTQEGNAILAEMLTGSTAPFFWFEIVGGLALPFMMLVFSRNRKRRALVIGASVLVVCGVFCKRVWLLFTSFVHPNVYGGNGITLGTKAAQQGGEGMWSMLGSYAPTPFEVIIVIGVAALGVLAFMVLCKALLPKWQSGCTQGEANDVASVVSECDGAQAE